MTTFTAPAIPAAGYLLLDFLDWLHRHPRTYAETMDAWRSSCPRLSIWEDALAACLVTVERTTAPGAAALQVRLTPAGHALVRETRK